MIFIKKKILLGTRCSTKCGYTSSENLYASAYEIKKTSSKNLFVCKINFELFHFIQLQEERTATIERDNRILLEKMSHIMRTTGGIDNRNEYEPRRYE